MSKQKIINLIERYSPSDEEIETKIRLLAFIEKYDNCFERDNYVGHITGSAWLLNKTGEKALLMHHKKLGIWLQPGGHADGDAKILAVALREAVEESGIKKIVPVHEDIFDIDIHTIPFGHEPEHQHFDIRFLFRAVEDDDLAKNEESFELRWVDKNEKNLPTKERSVVRLFEKWQSIRL